MPLLSVPFKQKKQKAFICQKRTRNKVKNKI